jgi:hypothetical protein
MHRQFQTVCDVRGRGRTRIAIAAGIVFLPLIGLSIMSAVLAAQMVPAHDNSAFVFGLAKGAWFSNESIADTFNSTLGPELLQGRQPLTHDYRYVYVAFLAGRVGWVWSQHDVPLKACCVEAGTSNMMFSMTTSDVGAYADRYCSEVDIQSRDGIISHYFANSQCSAMRDMMTRLKRISLIMTVHFIASIVSALLSASCCTFLLFTPSCASSSWQNVIGPAFFFASLPRVTNAVLMCGTLLAALANFFSIRFEDLPRIDQQSERRFFALIPAVSLLLLLQIVFFLLPCFFVRLVRVRRLQTGNYPLSRPLSVGVPGSHIPKQVLHSSSVSLAIADEAPVLERLECVVCRENMRQIVLLPCGHMVLCVSCSARLYGMDGQNKLNSKCPICRQSVSYVMPVKLS